MTYSKAKTLEEEVKAIKAEAKDRHWQQDHERRDKLIKDVHRARGRTVVILMFAL